MILITIFLVIILVPFIVMPRDIKGDKTGPYMSVLKSVIVTLTAVLGLVIAAMISGHPLYDGLHSVTEQVVNVLINEGSYKNIPGFEQLSEADAKKSLLAVYDMMIKRLPAYIAAASLVISYFDYIMLSRSIRKRQPAQIMPPFRDFNYQGNVFLPMILMLLASWLIGKSGGTSAEILYLSINYIFDIAFAIQGASTIFTLCYVRKWPKAVAVITVIVFWNIYILRQALVILGMFDLVFGMKRLFYAKADQNNRK